MNLNFLGLLFIVASFISLYIGVYGLRKKESPFRQYLFFSLLAVTIWTLFYGLELLANKPFLMRIFLTLQYLGISTISAFLFLFTNKYVSNEKIITRRTIILIFIIPLIVFVANLTNRFHNLFYANIQIETLTPHLKYQKLTPGPIYWLHIAYSNILSFVSLVLFIRLFFRVSKDSKKKVIFFIIGIIVPYIVNVAYVMGLKPYGFLDINPFGFIAMSMIFAIGLFTTDNLFNFRPIALNLLFDSMQDAIFIMDKNEKLLTTNPSANTLLKKQDHETIFDIIKQKDNCEIEIQVGRNYYIKTVNRIISSNNSLFGTLVIIRDITEKKQAEMKLEAARHRIIESINYASRIQKALLPSKQLIDKIFPENFIFFRPKDVVSGDFYFAKEYKNYFFIAVADCTGHGVPGAMMSMLGISFLNEIIRKQDVQNSAQLLNELRTSVKQALKQDDNNSENQDGMDIAFVAIDINKKEIDFAGANANLYIKRNGDLIELKGDKMPIGIYRREKEFSHQTIDIQNNDILYMFSDGFSSQFGGPNFEKYKQKCLLNLLFENSNKDLIEQERILDQKLNEWKKEYDQTDDILIMGLKAVI